MHITYNLFVYAQYGVGQVVQWCRRKASEPYLSLFPVVTNHVGAAGIIFSGVCPCLKLKHCCSVIDAGMCVMVGPESVPSRLRLTRCLLLAKILAGRSVSCVSVVLFVSLFLTYKSQFKSSQHQTLHTARHASREQLIRFWGK